MEPGQEGRDETGNGTETEVNDWQRFLFGGAGTTAVAGTATGAEATGYEATAAQAATPEEIAQAKAGASGLMANYDALTAQDTAGGAAATMARAQEAARSGAASQSDQAVAQAVKAAKTSGMLGGQAALAGSAQAANAYGAGMAQGVEQFGQNVNRQAQLGQSMNERLQNAANLQAAINQSNASLSTQASIASAANKTSASESTAANQTTASTANAGNQTTASVANAGQTGAAGTLAQGASSGAGAIAGIASLFSDRRLKEDVKKKSSISDSLAKIQGYAYKYKGNPRQEAGIMAQDAEKTAAAPAVIDTPQGKMIDTRRLSTINTAAISEQGRRIKDIENLLRELKGVKNA
jgi:hypothetical protein